MTEPGRPRRSPFPPNFVHGDLPTPAKSGWPACIPPKANGPLGFVFCRRIRRIVITGPAGTILFSAARSDAREEQLHTLHEGLQSGKLPLTPRSPTCQGIVP